MLNIGRIIYKLERQFGSPIDLYVESKEKLNPDTGRITVIRNKYHIKRAIVLPVNSAYNNPLANSIAKLSGTMIMATRTILIRAEQLKIKEKFIIPEQGNYIDYRGSRYEISQIEQLDRKVGIRSKIFGYQLVVKEAEQESTAFIFDQQLNDRLAFAQKYLEAI